MYSRSILALLCATQLLLVLVPSPTAGQRIYIRHKRSIERENEPAKESTLVFHGPNSTNPAADLPKDFENEIAGGAAGDKDCKDFLEFDYNPINDSLFFNGRVPSVFQNHHRNLNSFEEMFHRMLNQATQMFNRFPMQMPAFNNNNYPDNYNGTVEEEVVIGGQRFRKKQHVINKSSGGSKISIMSTVYEPVTDNTTLIPEASDAGTVLDDLTDGKIINYK